MSYDFPVPNDARPRCIGPWIKPSLVYSAWLDLADGRRIMEEALQAFNYLLVRLSKEKKDKNNFIVVPIQGQFVDRDWANEFDLLPISPPVITGYILRDRVSSTLIPRGLPRRQISF